MFGLKNLVDKIDELTTVNITIQCPALPTDVNVNGCHSNLDRLGHLRNIY